eukprot:scaffold85665_cov75-Attheya_sp.AAC.2
MACTTWYGDILRPMIAQRCHGSHTGIVPALLGKYFMKSTLVRGLIVGCSIKFRKNSSKSMSDI